MLLLWNRSALLCSRSISPVCLLLCYADHDIYDDPGPYHDIYYDASSLCLSRPVYYDLWAYDNDDLYYDSIPLRMSAP